MEPVGFAIQAAHALAQDKAAAEPASPGRLRRPLEGGDGYTQ